MYQKILNQYLLISTFHRLKNTNDNNIIDLLLKKEYLKERLNNTNLGYYSYFDALISIQNEANENKRNEIIDKILDTTDFYFIKEIKKNPPLEDYIMTFLNYLYFELYYGTEKTLMPKKIKTFIRNTKLNEILKFKETIIKALGENTPISYKVNKIYEIIENFDYKSHENFTTQLDKISNYIDRILKNLISMEAIPFRFIFKHVYIPYEALIYRVSGNKESKDAENFNFLTNKVELSLNSYKSLYSFLYEIKINETNFSYLKNLNLKYSNSYIINNLADLSILMSHVLIEVSSNKLTPEDKQILYLFYKDIELLVCEYQYLIEYLE
ncbi:hypothetical protein [Caviibacter abscessus]|uniref:hypothetical protein n=1 Tax=Caviibacter abscessus TaxID=1766719 RepID=UPI0008337630|nr:hypothetical protein [Caviibacter abscessus]